MPRRSLRMRTTKLYDRIKDEITTRLMHAECTSGSLLGLVGSVGASNNSKGFLARFRWILSSRILGVRTFQKSLKGGAVPPIC